MSMNLVFSVNGGAGYVGFPFQTPTKLTRAVMRTDSHTERLALIKAHVSEWETDNNYKESIMRQIIDLFNNPNLTLTLI